MAGVPQDQHDQRNVVQRVLTQVGSNPTVAVTLAGTILFALLRVAQNYFYWQLGTSAAEIGMGYGEVLASFSSLLLVMMMFALGGIVLGAIFEYLWDWVQSRRVRSRSDKKQPSKQDSHTEELLEARLSTARRIGLAPFVASNALLLALLFGAALTGNSALALAFALIMAGTLVTLVVYRPVGRTRLFAIRVSVPVFLALALFSAKLTIDAAVEDVRATRYSQNLLILAPLGISIDYVVVESLLNTDQILDTPVQQRYVTYLGNRDGTMVLYDQRFGSLVRVPSGSVVIKSIGNQHFAERVVLALSHACYAASHATSHLLIADGGYTGQVWVVLLGTVVAAAAELTDESEIATWYLGPIGSGLISFSDVDGVVGGDYRPINQFAAPYDPNSLGQIPGEEVTDAIADAVGLAEVCVE